MFIPASPGVYVREEEPATRPIEGVGTSVAAFVGVTEKAPNNKPTLIPNWTKFTELFGGFVEGGYLAHSVYGYFQNGGRNCYVVSVGTNEVAAESGDGAPRKAITNDLPQAQIGPYRVTATEAAPRDRTISVSVAKASGEAPPDDQFRLVVTVDGKEAESFDNVSIKRGAENVATKVNKESKLIRVEETTSGSALMRPDESTATLEGPAPVADPPTIERLTMDDYIGVPADRTGFSGLEAVDEVTILAVPDLVAALERGAIDELQFRTVQTQMMAHCELMLDRVAILDPPPGLSVQQVKDWRASSNYDSKYATMYWPYIQVFDPPTQSHKFVPPSGYMAGVWARSDDQRGVHKAPANEVVRGAVGLETQITRSEHDILTPTNINCIRSFPGRGIRVWGARTLSSDKAWQYLNVRRLFCYLEESIDLGMQWVVYEPNDDALWARIRRSISAFLITEWRKGALFGQTPDEAFFVRCDRETNPPEAIDAGVVTCRIGVAPVKPAEFVVFELSQLSSGTSLVAE